MGRPRKSSTSENSNENKTSFSPYMLLNAWMRDGNLKSNLPKDIEDCKAFNQSILLYYFITSPKLMIWINNNFNNFGLFSIPVRNILDMMKVIVHHTGFRQQYVASTKKEENKLCDLLKKKFPYYKSEEISMVVDMIDSDDDMQSMVYENFGIRNPSKKKCNVKDFNKKLNSILSKESMLNDL